MVDQNIIDTLRYDSKYYGAFGRQYLSNSDIGNLLSNPNAFRKEVKKEKPLIMGAYFHTAMLEDHKLLDYDIVDVASRNSKAYKDVCPKDDIMLLQSEVDEINTWTNRLKSNFEISDLIYDERNVYEEPMVKEIQGMLWKGKADIVHKDFVIDLKSTSDQDKFKYSAYNYNYDSQAYIYQELFGKQMMFITICKKSLRLKKWYTTPEFIASGEEKVSRAIEVYKRFFSDQSTEDINNFVEVEDL
tara:strand:- start:3983 stop:4714 length:732 start_codon:yes stop_codon:yes gene_type:complete